MHLNLALPLLVAALQTPLAPPDTVRRAALPILDSPNPALDLRFRSAKDDTLLSARALIAAGDFKAARPRLERGDSSAEWLTLMYDYWNASGDRAFLRRHWPQLTRALRSTASAPPQDSAVWHNAVEGMRAMARWFGESATARQADSLLLRINQTELVADSATAYDQYALHRGWSGYRMLKDSLAPASDMVLGIMRGVIGWWVDVPNRAAALEPHMPAEWQTFRAARLRFGRELVEARFRREAGSYEIHLQRSGSRPAMALRLAPALPLGARVRSVIVNDHDVPVHLEESLHDTHVVIETTLSEELSVEIDYEAGIDVHAPTTDMAVIDFRRAARGYALVVEAMGGTTHQLVLRSEARLRQIEGALIVEQRGARVVIQIDFPAAAGLVRREIQLRP